MRGQAAIALSFAIAAALAASSCNGTFRFDERSIPSADAGSDGEVEGDGATDRSCASDADCTGLGLRCDLSSGRCVACLADDDCAAPMPRCSPELRVCVGCLETADCDVKQRCEPWSKTCVETCAEGLETCLAPGFACDEHEGLCVECRTSSHCTGNPNGARCAPHVGRCVECIGNAQCPADRPKCDPRRGACVGCVTSTDCAPGQACPPSTSTCTALP